MGKMLIVALLVIGSIFVLIILSVQDQTEEVPELLTSNLAELQAKALCREALVYGMNKVNDGSVITSPGTNYRTYPNLEVLDSTIDSIQYISNATNDTIEISSYASYQVGEDLFQHKSSAVVYWAPTSAQGAMYANGDITVSGSAVVEGNLFTNSNPRLDFEELFGMTKAEMEAIADTVLVDPGPNPTGIEGITWVNGNLQVTSTGWAGSGILVVDGNAHFTGGTFSGIMWITGNLIINGNNGFYGAVYIEGGLMLEDIEDVNVLGDCLIVYDVEAIIEAFADVSLTLEYEIKIFSMFEDD